MFEIEHNLTISIERSQYIQIQKLEDWDHDEQTVYLKNYGMVKVFRQIYKNSYRYYISVPNLDNLPDIRRHDFEVGFLFLNIFSSTFITHMNKNQKAIQPSVRNATFLFTAVIYVEKYHRLRYSACIKKTKHLTTTFLN